MSPCLSKQLQSRFQGFLWPSLAEQLPNTSPLSPGTQQKLPGYMIQFFQVRRPTAKRRVGRLLRGLQGIHSDLEGAAWHWNTEVIKACAISVRVGALDVQLSLLLPYCKLRPSTDACTGTAPCFTATSTELGDTGAQWGGKASS